jgi:nitrite reductase/ring-hydroxylating ferredoxin subunit
MNDQAGWHPLALSTSIEPGSAAGARLFGNEFVVWRDAGGTAHVWEDRCPHRGMKLSFGFVRGERLACLYHGWQYNGAGACQYIPAHPDLAVPATIKVPTFSTQEQAGMIWTTLDDDPQPPPAVGAGVVSLCSLYLDCGVDAAIEALGAVRLTPFGSDGLADTVVDRLAARLLTVIAGSERLLIGVQTISEGRTALHITIPGPRSIYEGAGQRHYLAWALALRRLIEPARAHQPAGLYQALRPLEAAP